MYDKSTTSVFCSELVSAYEQSDSVSLGCIRQNVAAGISSSARTSVQADELMGMQTYLKATDVLKHATYASEAIAIVFNIINVCVLSSRRMRSPTMAYVVALSVAHLVYTFYSCEVHLRVRAAAGSNGSSILTIAVLKKHSEHRRQMKTNVDARASQMRELQLTITILVSTILFVLLNLPTVSNSIAYNAYPVTYGPFSVQKYLFYFLQDFGGVCFLLTFSTDFFTYVALSSAYRSCLRGFFNAGQKDSLEEERDEFRDNHLNSYLI
ncbi:hypothetical protein C0Q70_19589 [Pomacea canaliculata]|uniref:G-protein coupled receptors family 1 profile domain-containing protein n=1 Tax=Pomacea canaliculata TaxID=400727 RepID=A0A2T7NJT3_POMCA|nr:hypothetical protein C0Q70_19589 [Pomacea canaliculata]